MSKYTLYGKITIEHVERSALWALKQIARKKRDKPAKIDGTKRVFDMQKWDCGSACCVAGGAALLAGCAQKPVYSNEDTYDTEAGRTAKALHDKLAFLGVGTGENALAYAFRAVNGDRAPQMVLAACDAIRAERGLPPRGKEGKKK